MSGIGFDPRNTPEDFWSPVNFRGYYQTQPQEGGQANGHGAAQSYGERHPHPSSTFLTTSVDMSAPFTLPNSLHLSFAAFGYSVTPPAMIDVQKPLPPNHEFGSERFIAPGALETRLDPQADEPFTVPVTPVSPLKPVSPRPPPPQESPETGSRAGLRRKARVSYVPEESPPKKKARRSRAWQEGLNEGPNVSQQQKDEELQELRRLTSAGPAASQERRRLQNRLAQRSFRARAKLTDREAAEHLSRLETFAEEAQEKMDIMEDVIERLRQENALLRQRLDRH